MVVEIRVFCYHKDEPELDTGFYPAHEMEMDPLEGSEYSFVCPECKHEVYVTFEPQTSGGTQ